MQKHHTYLGGIKLQEMQINETNMSELVRKTFSYCSLREGEDPFTSLRIQGIHSVFWLNQERLEEKRALITDLVGHLSRELKKGISFLEICFNKDGILWTAESCVCENLLVIALGLNLIRYVEPQEEWASLPMQTPHIIVN